MEINLGSSVAVKRESNETPFIDLRDFTEGKYSTVKLSRIYPDFVVKEGRTKWREEDTPGTHPLGNEERISQDTKAIVENFGEFIPKTQLVKGKNEKGEVVIYIIQEKVSGKHLSEIQYSEKIAEQLGVFFDKVTVNYIQHLFYAPKEKEPRSFYPDLNALNNFILGTTKGDSPEKLYYVDTYPIGGGTPTYFVDKIIPKLISRWPAEWRSFLEEYAKKFKLLVGEYILAKKDIPKQTSDSLYRK